MESVILNDTKCNQITNTNFEKYGKILSTINNFNLPDIYTVVNKIANSSVCTCFESYKNDCFIENISGNGFIFICNTDMTAECFLFNKPLKILGGVKFHIVSNCVNFEYAIAYYGISQTYSLEKENFLNIPCVVPNFSVLHISLIYKVELKIGMSTKDLQNNENIFIYVEKGEIELESLQHTRMAAVTQGHIIIIPPNVNLIGYNKSNETASFIVIDFEMNTNQTLNVFNKVIQADNTIIENLKEIMKEYNHNKDMGDVMMISKLNITLINIIRNQDKGEEDGILRTMFSIKEADMIVDRVNKIIDDNIFNPDFSAVDVSRIMTLSQSHLARTYKSLTNQTIAGSIKDIRLEKAKNMLVDGKYSISEISERLSFCSIHYFSTEFKRKYGFSPREYVQSIE